MAKSRKGEPQSEQPQEQPPEPVEAGAEPAVKEAGPATTRLSLAESKLDRMQEINKFCFRHQNDFPKIEQELRSRFHCSDSEVEHLLEPKGQRMIPGYSYFEMERQKQYVAVLQRNSGPKPSHAEQVEQSREEHDGPSR